MEPASRGLKCQVLWGQHCRQISQALQTKIRLVAKLLATAAEQPVERRRPDLGILRRREIARAFNPGDLEAVTLGARDIEAV